MKGLLKGFRLIHDIFDEKEQEMQIGQPTDVKHVAHIGMDGPAANKPAWMSGFNSAQELSSDTLVNDLQDGDLGGLVAGNPESLPPVEKQKKTRRKASTENGTAVESPEGGEKAEKGEKHRRHRSSNHSTESAGGESSSHGRRHHSNRSTGGESLSNDVPDAPKKPRRKKTKDSDGGSSTRSKTASLPDAAEAELES
ncbi:hypothetical protein HRI_004662700 [Hibiscus trionum]|uniref:CRIB domain-containing protein n=1 Tax=Hibiscus trionum TaxID=183268 RepID=A0A9W7J8F5_HIBTR|nr:hypothetical protein HRI_004662700 [Hibiscus trionum]